MRITLGAMVRTNAPHLMRNMVIDAVISVIAVISIFAVINHASANARVEMLRKSGARLHDSFATAISVETYSDATTTGSIFESNPITDPDDFQFANDANRTTEPTAPTFRVFEIPGTHQRVEIHYPSLTSLYDERMGPDNLKIIE